MNDVEFTELYNHPIWKYCAIVRESHTGGYKIITIMQPPKDVIEDWVEKFGQ